MPTSNPDPAEVERVESEESYDRMRRRRWRTAVKAWNANLGTPFDCLGEAEQAFYALPSNRRLQWIRLARWHLRTLAAAVEAATAAEREACAAIADKMIDNECGTNEWSMGAIGACEEMAVKIRARAKGGSDGA